MTNQHFCAGGIIFVYQKTHSVCRDELVCQLILNLIFATARLSRRILPSRCIQPCCIIFHTAPSLHNLIVLLANPFQCTAAVNRSLAISASGQYQDCRTSYKTTWKCFRLFSLHIYKHVNDRLKIIIFIILLYLLICI